MMIIIIIRFISIRISISIRCMCCIVILMVILVGLSQDGREAPPRERRAAWRCEAPADVRGRAASALRDQNMIMIV